jgi:hypothetical protein
VLTAADLIAWTQITLLDAALPKAELKLLRYRMLHTAARIIHRGRRTLIKIAAGWPWAHQLTAAFTRLTNIRQPGGPDQPASHCPPTHKDLGEPDTKPATSPAIKPKINNSAADRHPP